MELTRDIGPHAASLITLAATASEPYDAFVCDDAAEIAEVQRVLFESGSSEYSPPHALLLIEGAELLGVNATMTAEELAACRLRAARALSRLPWLARDSAVRRRMQLASATLTRNEPGDLHCTRQAVAPTARRRGYARLLWEEVERAAIREGARRLTLDVSPEHEGAIRLQESLGFEVVGRGEARDPETGRVLTYLHFAKRLA